MAKKCIKTNNIWFDVGLIVGKVVLEKGLDYCLDLNKKGESKNG